MAKKVYNGLNRRIFTQVTAAEHIAGNDYLAVAFQTPLPVDIYGLNWGYSYGLLADKALHINGWMAIVENYFISTTLAPAGFSVLNPEEGIFGDGVVRYVDVNSEVQGAGNLERTFPAPIRIDPGHPFSVIVNKPYTSAGIGGTMFYNLTLFASPVQIWDQDPNPLPWAMAGSRYRKK